MKKTKKELQKDLNKLLKDLQKLEEKASNLKDDIELSSMESDFNN